MKKIILLFIIVPHLIITQLWTQKVADIDGEAFQDY